MRSAIAALALAAAVHAMPQGVTDPITPSSSAPSECQSSYPGNFQITVVNVTSNAKRDLEERQAGTLTLSLDGGILKDQQGRSGYIASNRQFQFDAPPQAGAIYTAGFSVCGNGSLALGGSAIWYQCYSGGFYNLYDSNWAPQCSPIYIQVIGGNTGASGSPQATQASDGQPGQVSAGTTVPQRSDGQPFASTTEVTQRTDGQPFATVAPISQLSDGQPQGPVSAPNAVSQQSDGQPIATSAPATAPPVSVKSEGQPVATSAASAPPVSVAPEGQPQVTAQSNATTPSAPPPAFTGAATVIRSTGEMIAAVVGFIGAIALL